MEKEPKIENNNEKQPIVDIELNQATLDEWERLGLRDKVKEAILLAASGGRITLNTARFMPTRNFMIDAKNEFVHHFNNAKNKDKKIEETDNFTKKAILNFAFRELGFDVKNPEIARTEEAEEEINGEKKELTLKYFKTNQPDMFLVFDGIDWWLEGEGKDS